MKKLAFLFLTINNHKQPKVWETFFESSESNYSIYNHPSEPHLVTDVFLKDNIIPKLVKTEWGKISLVEATINMMEEAYNDIDNYKFILLSDSCIPIVLFKDVYLFLTNTNDSYILSYDGNKYRYDKLLDKSFVNKTNFKKQHQWMILNREAVDLILKTRHHTEIFKNMFAPDEHYFTNILVKYNFPFKNRGLTYCDWRNATEHPKTFAKLDNKVVTQIRKRGFIFVRKVDDKTLINFSLQNLHDNI
jgi:hypothetical protein